jgi:hypothetical protein
MRSEIEDFLYLLAEEEKLRKDHTKKVIFLT